MTDSLPSPQGSSPWGGGTSPLGNFSSGSGILSSFPSVTGAIPVGSPLPAKNATVTRKLEKIMDITIDDSFRESLEYLSSFYSENTPQERKNLRGLLEKKVLDLHEDFLREFSRVNDAFQVVQKDIDDLGKVCEDVSTLLQDTQQEAAAMLTKAAVLQSELREVTEKEEQIKEIQKKFQLTPEEKAHLHGEINADFFATLNKVQSIHRHSKELLSLTHHTAGIELMEEMYMYQLAGFERLFKHTHKLCLELMLADVPEIPSHLTAALSALRERSALWVQCMQEVVKGRRTARVRNFFDALTAGVNGARPIDLNAHDPVRYVGDILAWVHQAVAEEAELLGQFFPKGHASPVQTPLSPATAASPTTPSDTPELTKAEMLDQIFEGLCKHLKSRLEQVFTAVTTTHPQSMVILFKLQNILEFYSEVVPQITGPAATLAVLLNDMKLHSMRHLFDVLKAMSDRLLAIPVSLPSDLTPPAIVQETLEKLTMILEALTSSLIPKSEREAEFSHVISAIVDPLVNLCGKVPAPDVLSQSIFNLNCLHAIQTTLSAQGITTGKAQNLALLIDTEVQRLVGEQAALLLRKCGLDDKIAKLETRTLPLAQYPTTSPVVMRETMKGFYDSLETFGANPAPQCDKLVSLRLREDVGRRVVCKLADAYAALYVAVTDVENGYPNPKEIVVHPPEKVKLLLDAE